MSLLKDYYGYSSESLGNVKYTFGEIGNVKIVICITNQ